jgi:cell division protein ZapA
VAQVIIEINGKPYGVGCEDGQESHVRSLAALIDAKVGEVAHEAGALGETRLMLLGGLMLADEVSQLRSALAAAQARIAHLEAESDAVEARSIAALEVAAQKLEAMAAR